MLAATTEPPFMDEQAPEPLNQTDANHVKLLGQFHYVLGCITIVLAFCPSIHVTLGILALTGSLKDANDKPMPMIFGIMFTVFPALVMVGGWVLGGLMLYTGRLLRSYRRLTFCQVIAGIECIFMPLGTVLGVLSLIVLSRPSVQDAFDGELA